MLFNKSFHTKNIASKNMGHKKALQLLGSAILVSTLSGCFNNGSDNKAVVIPPPPPVPMEYSYDITVTNLTYAQPLSPAGIVLHADSTMWQVGEMASNALEKLAESGDNSELLSDASALATKSADGVLIPGNSVTVSISTTDENAKYLTLATMLVNTNDAFSGLTGVDLSNFTVDMSKSWRLPVLDAGTEANSELEGTIPGPADGGTGYDMARDDIDVITLHSGVVSQDDGLSTSVLTQAHKFDNPAVKVTITRTK